MPGNGLPVNGMLKGVKGSAVGAGPALTVTSLAGAVVALVTAFGHLTTVQSATLASLATAIGVLVAAVRARSVDVAAVTGAAGIVLEDLTLFNVHLSSGQVSAVVAGIAVVLGALMHLTGADNPARAPVPPVAVTGK